MSEASAPTGLVGSKLALLQRMLQAGGSGAAERASIINRRPADARVPLSHAQEPLWFFSQVDGRDTTYNVIYLIGIAGRLDVDAVRRSMDSIFARHEILRTTFPMVKGQPEQQVAAQRRWTPDIVDLRGLAPSEWERMMLQLVNDEAARHFDLERGPLTHSVLITLAEDKQILFNSMHHIVCDTWSVGLFDHEFRVHYDAIQRGTRVPLAERQFQFGDYALWERDQMRGSLFDAHLAYWRKQFAGIRTLALPFDRAPPAQREFPAKNELLVLDDELAVRLKSLAERYEATLYMVLLTGFKVLLSRYAQQFDVTVGTPNAGRSRPEIADMIGFTTTLMALRTDLSGDPAFAEALMRVKKTSLDAFSHADVPLQKLLSEIRPERGDVSLKRHSMFQVMFSFQTIRFPASNLPAELDLSRLTRLVRFTIPHPSAKSDLYLYLRDLNGRLIGGFEYDTDVFDRDTILRLRAGFETLLRAASAAPDTPVSRLPVMPPDERHRIVHAWNDTEVAYADHLCLHQHFARQARETPDLPAVSCGDEVLTYAELARRASTCARRLAAMGVGPESAVGLHFERSTDLAVAVIGTLESGGVCVPLEPSLPAQRLRGMIEDAAVKIVLCDRALADQAAPHDCRVVRLEEMAEELVPPVVSADNAAFIFFTSGSTGRPNAVVVTHRAAASGQCPETAAIRLQPGDCLLLTAPISSARLLGELFWPLFAGAQVCMATPDGHADYRYLLDEISRRRISVLSMVPSMLATFLQGNMTKCASLRTVFAVGEALPDAVKASFCESTDAELCNAYAQTEACPVTFCRVREQPERPAATIGKPGVNTRTYVLDACLDPVPIGAAGHLYVAGSGLARGYLGQPALTALKFVPDPLSGRPGERMYWTGDVAKYLPSGDLVSLGRNDLRVKVRGYRIELQEIEMVLMEHPLVQECAVAVDVRSGSESRLTAYVVARDGVPLRANELRRVLKQKLPLHMVPASFTYLAQLPRNASGKIDRLALSQQGHGTPVQDEFVEARTPLEMHIAQVWTSVLGGRRVGINDNFFDLGGDSLSAVEAIARIKERSGASIRPRDMIFLTLEQIARLTQPTGQ